MMGLLITVVSAILTTALGIGLLQALLPDPELRETRRQHAAAAPFIKALELGEAIEAPMEPEATPQPQGQKPRRRPALRESDCDAAGLTRSHNPFDAAVGRVVDGDTLTVILEGDEIRVRLWGIDAPEKAQPGGEKATHALQRMAPPGTRTTVHPVETDRYGRMVAVMGPRKSWSTNVLMVAGGNAFHVDAYGSRGNRCLKEAQKVARNHRMGVWKDTDPTPPWEFRQKGRGSQG
jgi:endonuclease YncB( thermonuclease family)